jgi:hypothetical protein
MNASPALGLRPSQNHSKVRFKPRSTFVPDDRLHEHSSPLAFSCSSGALGLEWHHIVNLAISTDLHFGVRVLERPYPRHLPPRVLALQVTNAKP